MAEMGLELKVTRKSWVTGVTMVVEAKVTSDSIKIFEKLERGDGFYESDAEEYFFAKGQNPEFLDTNTTEIPLWEPGGIREKYVGSVDDFPTLEATNPQALKFAQLVLEMVKLGHLEAFKNSQTRVSCPKEFESFLLNKLRPVDGSRLDLSEAFDREEETEMFKEYDYDAYEIATDHSYSQKDRTIWVNETPWLTFRTFFVGEEAHEIPQYVALPLPSGGQFERVQFAHWEWDGALFHSGRTKQVSHLFDLSESLYVLDLISSSSGSNHAMVTRLDWGSESEILASWLHTLESRWVRVFREFRKMERKLEQDNYVLFFKEDALGDEVADEEWILEAAIELKMKIINGFHLATRNYETKTVFDDISDWEIREKFWLNSFRLRVRRPCVMWRLEMLEGNSSILARAESKIQKLELHDGAIRYGAIERVETDTSCWKVIPDLSTEVSRNYWGGTFEDDIFDEIWLYETLQSWPGLQYQISGNLSEKELLAIIRSLTFGDWEENEFNLLDGDECAHCVSDLGNTAVNFNRPTEMN
jgi:hypothetical protein